MDKISEVYQKIRQRNTILSRYHSWSQRHSLRNVIHVLWTGTADFDPYESPWKLHINNTVSSSL